MVLGSVARSDRNISRERSFFRQGLGACGVTLALDAFYIPGDSHLGLANAVAKPLGRSARRSDREYARSQHQW